MSTETPAPENPAVKAAESIRDQIERWFTWHKPTKATAPKYEAITAARDLCEAVIVAEGTGRQAPDFDKVGDALKAFAHAIVDHAPQCADTTAALRCLRLARNAANALLRRPGDGALQAICIANLYAAQWQANGAIALGGK